MKFGTELFNCKISTKISPVAFFDSFFTENKIVEAKNRFIDEFPDRDNPDQLYASCLSYVSSSKLEYHLEFTIENYDPETLFFEIIPVTKIVSFSNELEALFRSQYYTSKDLMKDKFDDARGKGITTKSKREAIRKIITKVISCYTHIENNTEYLDYKNECIRPLSALIALIYREYIILAPAQHYFPQVEPILKFYPKHADLYEGSQLKSEVIDAMFQKKVSGFIFQSHFPEKDISDLKLFIGNGNHKGIKRHVKLYGEVGKINFTIATLLLYAKISRPNLEELNFLFINDIKFIARTCDKEYSRYQKSSPIEAATIEAIIKDFLE
jgi:hypothetical protein